MVTALEADTIRPVLLGRFDILTDPLVAWTGYGAFAPTGTGDPALDGQTFFAMAPYMELSDVKEDQGIGGPTTITVSGHDLDEELLRQIIRDKRQWRGRKAWLWLGLYNADESTVVTSPARIKTGVMTQMVTNRSGDDASVSVTIDQDLGRARGSLFRWLDHIRVYPVDTWSTFIVALSNQPGGITDQNVNLLDDRDYSDPNIHIP
jgi:hypothetical protein